MIRSFTRIAAAGLFLALLAGGSVPAMAQELPPPKELPIAPLDRKWATDLGFADPSLMLVLNSRGELVGALTEDNPKEPSNGKARKVPPKKRAPENLTGIRDLGSFSILAYTGSNCYIVRGADGTLYVLPPGCQ